MAERDHYIYRLSWSAEDDEHVAACAGFPSLSWLDDDGIEALRGIKKLVREAVEDLRASGEPVPEPLADRDFSGRFVVRIPPGQHRALAVRAAEAGVSLNRYVEPLRRLQARRGGSRRAGALPFVERRLQVAAAVEDADDQHRVRLHGEGDRDAPFEAYRA